MNTTLSEKSSQPPEKVFRMKCLMSKLKLSTVATSLLVVMGAGLITGKILEADYPWMSFVIRFCEAALVGGLADWFAVTALFRHPMGLPIPHTALIPKSKDRIAEGIGTFSSENFLNSKTIVPKIRSFSASGLLITVLSHPKAAETLSGLFRDILPNLLEKKSKSVTDSLSQVLFSSLEKTKVSPLLREGLTAIIRKGHHFKLFDGLLTLVESFLVKNESYLKEKVAEKSAWYIPAFIDSSIGENVHEGILNFLRDLRTPGNEKRHKMSEAVMDINHRLRDDPLLQMRVETFKNEFFKNPDVQSKMIETLDVLKAGLIESLKKEDSPIEDFVQNSLKTLKETLETNQELRNALDRSVQKMMIGLFLKHKKSIITGMTNIVLSWDSKTLSQKIETSVGTDLQYIRLNGTIIGGIAGLGIAIIEALIS